MKSLELINDLVSNIILLSLVENSRLQEKIRTLKRSEHHETSPQVSDTNTSRDTSPVEYIHMHFNSNVFHSIPLTTPAKIENFQSLTDKISLVEEAVQLGDSELIYRTFIFLKVLHFLTI